MNEHFVKTLHYGDYGGGSPIRGGEDTHHTVGGMHAVQVDLCHESDEGRSLRVPGATLHLQAIHPVLIDGLGAEEQRETVSPRKHPDPPPHKPATD